MKSDKELKIGDIIEFYVSENWFGKPLDYEKGKIINIINGDMDTYKNIYGKDSKIPISVTTEKDKYTIYVIQALAPRYWKMYVLLSDDLKIRIK